MTPRRISRAAAIEKTDAEVGDLEARFGLPVAALVLAVSEDQRIIGYDERKAALREQVANAGREALTIFAADKISKARELRLETTRTHKRPAHTVRTPGRRLAQYRASLRLLEPRLPDSPLVDKLRAELEQAAPIPRGSSPVHDIPTVGGQG